MVYLAPDLFTIPGQGDEVVLYAPLLELVLQVDPGVAAVVERLRADPEAPIDPADAPVVASLREMALVSDRPYPPLAPDSRDAAFVPTSVTLFLTSRCNLGCAYCYAAANEAPRSMTWPVARAALDEVIANAAGASRAGFGVILHGGGEATLEWRLLQKIVGYARLRGLTRGLTPRITIGTNGVMAPRRARWLARSIQGATVSLDGPPDVNDENRPTVGGGSSYDAVIRTLGVFDAEGLRYGLRVTLTAAHIPRLPEIVASLVSASAAREIQVEPVFSVGRAERDGVAAPEASAFIEAFRAGAAVARAGGRTLRYSGARLGVITDRFCEAAGRSFAVTPDGAVSSCYEVSDPEDPRAATFNWGVYDATEGFLLDEAKRRAQARFGVHHKPHCEGCFCKWHCAGDCAAKVEHLGDAALSPRCEVNRALTRDQLLRALAYGEDALAEMRPSCEMPAAPAEVGG